MYGQSKLFGVDAYWRKRNQEKAENAHKYGHKNS